MCYKHGFDPSIMLSLYLESGLGVHKMPDPYTSVKCMDATGSTISFSMAYFPLMISGVDGVA